MLLLERQVGTVRSLLYSMSLIAVLAGGVMAGVGAASVSEPSGALAKSDRLPFPRYLGKHSVTVEAPMPNGSRLCRLPIEISVWNSRAPGACD